MAAIQAYLAAVTAACVRSRISWPGKWRARRLAIGQVRRIGSQMGKRIVATTSGFLMELNLADWVDQHIYATETYEDGVAAVLCSVLRAGDVFVDVGANIGYFSLLAAKQTGTAGRVIAFEPVTSTRVRLQKNVALNRAGSVSVRSEAASDAPGEACIHIGPANHSGVSSLRDLDIGGSSETVTTARLCDVLDEPCRPRLMKIDVEGAELKVLRGLAPLLEKWGSEAPFIILEYSPEYLTPFGDSGPALIEFLAGAGYQCWRIDWDRITPLSESDIRGSQQFNLLACRNGLPEELGHLIKAPPGGPS